MPRPQSAPATRPACAKLEGTYAITSNGDSSYMICFNPADKDNSDQDKSWLYGLYEMKQTGFNYSTNAFVADKTEGKAFKVSDDATALWA